MRRLGLGRLALRQLRSRPAVAVAQGLTLVAAATLVTTVVLIQDAATNNGLRSALVGAGQGANLIIERDGIATPSTYDSFQRDATARVRAGLDGTVIAGASFGKSPTEVLRSIDGVAQGYPFSNLSSLTYYAGLRNHVRVVAGHWPADTRVGRDWQLTAFAQATDTLGTPLDLKVGSEYCFNPALFRGSSSVTWCGRIAATWVPTDVSDPYWAGHVPETDVATGHDSFFQIIAAFPGTVNSAIQQYSPDPAHINSGNTGAVIGGVNQLRGYYGVSGNDVFVSGLDTTVSDFLTRQSAAAGPVLVSTIGLLIVALAAMGFAALQFLDVHSGEVALWRARGWSRLRVWVLSTSEFAVLALLATLPAMVLAAAVTSVVSSGSATASEPGFGWAAIGAAIPPVLVAGSVFVAVLALVAAVRSGPELAALRRGRRVPGGSRNLRRRAVDVVMLVAGVAILAFVGENGAPAAFSTESSAFVLALPLLGVALLALASLRLVGVTARLLTITRSLSGRMARLQVERDPAQYARLCLLLTLAVALGVFASTYTASDRASAIDRADYLVGADMRATFSSAASPPQLDALTASLPGGVQAEQVFRDAGRPGRSGTDSTVLGIQGTGFWNVAYSRADFAAQPLSSLTARMVAADPDGAPVPGRPHALLLSVYSTGFDGAVQVEVTDATGREILLPMGDLATTGWIQRTASVATEGLVYPLRVRDVRISPTGSRAVGDVAVQALRTDSGAVIESFARSDGWWEETFAPDISEAPATPSTLHVNDGARSLDVPIDLEAMRLLPPPSSRPLPVLLASQTLASLGVAIGQSFPLHIDTVDVQLVPVGIFDEFPTYYPARGDLIVAPMASLVARLGNQQSTSPWPNELWLSVPSARMAAVSARVNADSTLLDVSTRSYAESVALDDPLRVGLHDDLGVGFILALAVVVVGFGLQFLAAARSRGMQFAIMRANGVPQAALRRALVAEQVVVLLTGLVAGTLIGLALTWAVVPVFTLGTLPEDLTPPSLLHVDVVTLAAVLAGTGVVALAVGRVVAGAGSRVDVMSTVRSLA